MESVLRLGRPVCPEWMAEDILRRVQADRRVQNMRNFIQHGQVSTYDHCERVARLSYRIDRRLNLGGDPQVLLQGAMLHDFYLYDWHHKDNGTHRLHGFTHAARACRNAQTYLGIDHRTAKVIYCHMWPLNPTRIPTSREAWVVCIADKLAALQETVCRR